MKHTFLLHVSFFERTSLDNGFIDRIFYTLVGEMQKNSGYNFTRKVEVMTKLSPLNFYCSINKPSYSLSHLKTILIVDIE